MLKIFQRQIKAGAGVAKLLAIPLSAKKNDFVFMKGDELLKSSFRLPVYEFRISYKSV